MDNSILNGRLTADDGTIVSLRCHVRGHASCVVIVHGFYNSKDAQVLEQFAHSLAEKYDIVLMDLRGHGQSSGLFTWTSREWMDVKVVMESVRRRYRKVGVIAFSFGGSVVIDTLARYPLADVLVCVSAPARFWGVNYHFWELSFSGDLVYTLFTRHGRRGKGVRPGPLWYSKRNAIDVVGRLRIPILFIHGTKDWVVKHSHSQDLYDAAVGEKKLVIIDNGPHAEYLLRDNEQKVFAEVEAWFLKMMV